MKKPQIGTKSEVMEDCSFSLDGWMLLCGYPVVPVCSHWMEFRWELQIRKFKSIIYYEEGPNRQNCTSKWLRKYFPREGKCLIKYVLKVFFQVVNFNGLGAIEVTRNAKLRSLLQALRAVTGLPIRINPLQRWLKWSSFPLSKTSDSPHMSGNLNMFRSQEIY